jgi:outer membrane lipoprotein carrier protein
VRWRVILTCYLMLLSAALRADVLETLAAREGMAGQFTQEIISPEGEVLERSQGNFSLLRPHFFRWEILAPDSQLLLANSDQVTQIDWDLEVVVERPIIETASSPFQWLLASRATLDSAFDISLTGDAAVLIPMDLQSPYQRLEIAQMAETVWKLVAEDRGGQVLRVELREYIDRPPQIADFVAPVTPF